MPSRRPPAPRKKRRDVAAPDTQKKAPAKETGKGKK